VSGKWDNYLVVWYKRKWKESDKKDISIFSKWHINILTLNNDVIFYKATYINKKQIIVYASTP